MTNRYSPLHLRSAGVKEAKPVNLYHAGAKGCVLHRLEQELITIAKKVTLAELRQRYEDKPTECNVYTLDGVEYRVISHYTGEKDIDKVIIDLAVKKAYEETKADTAAE